MVKNKENAVANIMSQINLQEQEPTSMWGKFKNFAGSDTGRKLLGGLGSAATIALMGGGARNALYAGVLGAGKTADNLYTQEQDRLAWAEKEANRKALIDNQEANRELQKTLQTNSIKAQKDLAETNYNKALDLLNTKATLEEQAEIKRKKAEDDYFNDLYVKVGLTPEQITYANLQRKGIDPNNMTSQMAYYTLYNPNATPEQKELAREQLVNIANVNKEIKDITKPSLTLDDIASGAKNFNISVKPDSFGDYIKSGNLSDLVWTDKPLSGDLGLLIYMRDTLKMPTDEALDRLGKMTQEQKKQMELQAAQGKSDIKVGEHQQISNIDTNAYGTKAGIDFGYQQQGADKQLDRDKDLEGYKFDLGEKKADNALTREKVMADYNAKIAQAKAEQEASLNKIAKDEALRRDMELAKYKASLPSERQRQITEMSIASGIPEKDIYQQMYNKMEKEGKQLDITPSQVATAVGKGAISPEIGNSLVGQEIFQAPISAEDKEYNKQVAKNKATVEKGLASAKAMKPQVEQALSRAKDAARNGSGLGIFGGALTKVGFNPIDNSARNFADIQSANSQMNAYLRQKLQATGLTGTELNSAVEAEAYRYTISPYDDEDVILRKITNFENDYLTDAPIDDGFRIVGVR